MRRIADDGGDAELPEVSSCEYLLQYFFEVGPALVGGFGPAPLTHGELRAWQDNTGVDLMPWESRMLRGLSRVWIQESRRSESSERSPLQELREAMSAGSEKAAALKASLRALAAL